VVQTSHTRDSLANRQAPATDGPRPGRSLPA